MSEQIHWTEEADVVVVGYGGAGAVTAIAAHDAGAEVLILEKELQDLTDKRCKEVDELTAKKEQELMAV